MRPLVPSEEVGAAIRRALSLHGRPYDFSFDFASDDKIVCTELIYRAYDALLNLRVPLEHPASGVPGVSTLAGRLTLPANDLARYAVYMQDHPGARPEQGYPGRLLEILRCLDREESEGPSRAYAGSAAVEALRHTLDR